MITCSWIRCQFASSLKGLTENAPVSAGRREAKPLQFAGIS
jgi:hypothetical protein